MSDTPIIQFIGTDFLRCPAYESHAHEVHAHEAYAPKTDEHCAVFTIRHLLPHRSTLSTGLPPHETRPMAKAARPDNGAVCLALDAQRSGLARLVTPPSI
jgi:hypothetical protein